MTARWHDDILYLVVMAVLYIVALVVYFIVKRFRRRGRLHIARVEKWVDGTFAVILIGALVFVTFRYS
jgi:threonine/homoserine/homoserine lactone efflux protein